MAVVGAGAAGPGARGLSIPARTVPAPETALRLDPRIGTARFILTRPLRARDGTELRHGAEAGGLRRAGVDWDGVMRCAPPPAWRGSRGERWGSESVMLYAEPLAQACAALRDALAAGRVTGVVTVTERPLSELRAMRPGGLIGARPEIAQGRGIVTGAPLYAADVRLPGMLFGRVLRAPASSEVASQPLRWSIEAARAVPGFVAVCREVPGPPNAVKARGLFGWVIRYIDSVRVPGLRLRRSRLSAASGVWSGTFGRGSV